jgi:hypothetical protein
MAWLRRVLIVTALACAASAGLMAAARAQQCPVLSNLPPLQIAVALVNAQIVYHHDVDLFGLPRIERSSERPPPGMVLLGLTKIADELRAVYSTAMIPRPGGQTCVWLRSINATLGNQVMDVYVASEYAPGTCEYETILAHENRHVRFNLETLRDWLPTIRAALVEAARRKFPAIFPGTPTSDQITAYLLENVKSVFDLMNQDMARRNASIDTPASYRSENAKCRHWSRHGLRLDH